ncbi:MAG TPA: cytochrome c oxidase subunit II [Micropepsaceae bacterium]|nr:cytochrome c oxidase subunit II [Micropepsaceae bacterium]
MIRKLGMFTAFVASAMLAFAVSAQAAEGQPSPWQMGLQQAGDERMRDIIGLHNFVLVIITLICLFVLGLLAWIAVRYNATANPTPSATTHNTTLEVLWTVVPVLILVAIAIPSFRLLYFEDVIPATDMTVKAIGKQWFWTYEYPDNGNFTFDALIVPDRRSAPIVPDGPPRLLGTNNHVMVPVGKTIRLITTGADVIHSWAIPAFGVKIDAVPGRVNQTWFKPEKEGIYYGECSELCGARHAFMPITVEVVSQAAFDMWVAEAKTKFASVDAPTRVAAGR